MNQPLDILQLKSLLAASEGASPEVTQRLEWLVCFAECGSVSETCRRFGIARTTFYRWSKRFDPANLQSLEDATWSMAGPAQTPPAVAQVAPVQPAPVIQLAAAPLPVAAPTPHTCPLCQLKGFNWSAFRSAALITSIVFNLALASLIVFTALMEGQPTSAKTPAPAVIIPAEQNETSLLNSLFGIDIASAATGIYNPINYQGKLTNTGGIAIANGTYNMRFKIFSAASGGSPLWTEVWDNTNQRVTATGGLFSIALGTHTAMTGSVDFNSDSLYLQVEFDPANAGTYPEVFSPRRRFASVPYAHNADTLDGLNSTQFLRSDTDATASGTLTVSPKTASKVGISILSTAGSGSIAALKISTQGANHILFGTGGTTYDTNLYRSAVSTLKTDGNFTAGRMLSGARLTVSGNANVSGSLIVRKTISGAALEVLGTASGLNLFATQSISGTNLYAASTFGGAGLTSCSAGATSKLLWNAATKQFSCGTDQTGGSGTGNVIAIGDTRYVQKAGDTMTGALTINLSSGYLGLKVLQTISGAFIHAEKSLSSSGTILATGSITTRNTLSGKTLVVSGNASVTGSLVSVGNITTKGTLSGRLLTISNNATVSGTLVSVGNITTKGTLSGRILTVSSNGSISGALVVKKTISGAALEVLGTASGRDLFATQSVSGTYLYAASTFGGAGLTSCSNATTSKLLYNSATKQFSCGTDQTGGSAGTASFSGSVLLLGDARYVKKQGDTMTGALVINITGGNPNTLGLRVLNTISGAVIRAQNTLASSGTLIVKKYSGTNTGNTLIVDTQGLVYDASNKRVGIGTATPKAMLDVVDTISGKTLTISGNASVSGALIAVGNITTKGTLSGRLLTISGNSALSGALVVRKTISGAALEVLGTASGKDLFATKSISGTYLYAASTFGGAGLTDCSNGTTAKLLWNAATGRFSCGTDQTGGAGSNEVGTVTFSGGVLRLGDARYVKKSGDTMTGALVINLTTGTLGLNVLQGMSGNTLTVSKGAFFSGSGITFSSTGNTIFNRLNRNVDFTVKGQTDNNLLFVDASTDRVGIGTSLPKAKLEILGTLSGKTLTISGNGSFSGSLVVKKTISGAALEVLGTVSGVTLNATGTGARPLLFTSSPWAGVGIGTNTPTQRLTVSGGSILNLAGGNVKTLSGVNIGTQVNDIAVVGRYAYVAAGNSPNFRIVDITNPLSPKTVSSLNFGYTAQAVVVSGKFAYLGTTTTTSENLRVIDISNPSAPVEIASTFVGGSQVAVQAMAINGKHLYIGKAQDLSGPEFVVADITNPYAPKMVGSLDTGVGINAIAFQGNYAYLGLDDDLSSGNEFRVVDISGPNNPIDKGGLSLSTAVKSIAVSGRYAYVGLSAVIGNDFRIFDISNPLSVGTVGGLDVGTDVLSVDVAGNYVYMGMTSVTGNDFRVVNVANPASPAVVGGTDLSNSVRKVAVAGKYAYLGFPDTSGVDMVIEDINGIDAPSASIGSLGVEVLYVGRSATMAQSLNVLGGLNVGQGGIKSDGMLTVSVGSGATISGMTGAIIENRGFSGTVLALDSWRGNGTGSAKIVPHLLFGYRGVYDTMLYRAGSGVLANSGTLLLRGGTGRTLLKIESTSATQSDNIIEAFSNNGQVGSNPHNRVFRVTAGGDAKADGNFTGGGADYAERFLASTPNLQPGQAVCLDPLKSNTVKLCDRSGDPNVMGIISTKPAFVGDKYRGVEADGKSDATSAIVGLIGQLPAKTIVEDGQAIAVGDALATASKPGYVRKAKAGESTVGVALTPLPSGEGMVDVLITRRNQSDLVEKIENEVTQSIADMHIEDDVRQMVQSVMTNADINGAVASAVQNQVQNLNLASQINAILDQRLADGSLNLGSQGTLAEDVFSALRTASGAKLVNDAVSARLGLSRTGSSALTAASDLLVPGALTVQHDVLIGGTLHAAAIEGPLTVTGQFATDPTFMLGSIGFSGSAVRIGDIAAPGALQVVGNVTIDGLSTFLADVDVRGELIVSDRQAGYAVIPAGLKSVTVAFGTGFSATPVVTASPDQPVAFAVSRATSTGFVIRIAQSQRTDTSFSWLALATRLPSLAMGHSAAGALIPFHVDGDGRPFSQTDAIWNACIRDENAYDACRGYHQGTQWFVHPDIAAANMEVLPFTYDATTKPPTLVLPERYEAVVIDQTIGSSSSAASESSSESAASSSESSSESASSSEPAADEGQPQEQVQSSDSSSSSSEAASSSSEDTTQQPTEPASDGGSSGGQE